MSEIMLAVTFDPTKVTYPAEVSIKLDGVAADFYKTPDGWVAQSRQGKPIPSTEHIIKFLNKNFNSVEVNTHIIGELTVTGVDDFKDAGGIIRRQEVDERITLNIYDVYVVGKENEIYADRIKRIQHFTAKGAFGTEGSVVWSFIKRVPVCGIAYNHNDILTLFDGIDKLMETSNLFEGFMVRCLRGTDSKYKVGKRSRNMMRYKPKPTVDLEVVRFEEATANKTMTFLDEEFTEGEGLRAVGRIVALYKDKEIGVGPGTLTHVERRELWDRYVKAGKPQMNGRGLLAEIEYMVDNSYTALRQPIFKRWRKDKQEVSEHA